VEPGGQWRAWCGGDSTAVSTYLPLLRYFYISMTIACLFLLSLVTKVPLGLEIL
jgi:hypothetical protein